MIKSLSFKAIVPLLVVFFIAVSLPDANAQRPGVRRAVRGQKPAPVLRIKSKKVIRRTGIVMIAAHNQLKTGKVYTGDFAKAVKHQRYAVYLWRKGFYAASVYHSRRARMLAINVIQANKGNVQASYKMDKEENSLSKDAPPDADLDKEITNDTEYTKANPNISQKDEDFINIVVDDIDLSDLE